MRYRPRFYYYDCKDYVVGVVLYRMCKGPSASEWYVPGTLRFQ